MTRSGTPATVAALTAGPNDAALPWAEVPGMGGIGSASSEPAPRMGDWFGPPVLIGLVVGPAGPATASGVHQGV